MNDLITTLLVVGAFGLLVCGVTALADLYDHWQRRRRAARMVEAIRRYSA